MKPYEKTTKHINILTLCISFFALITLAACNPDPEYKHLEFSQLSTPPIAVGIVPNHIGLIAGIGAMVKVEPVSDNSNDYEKDDEVKLESENADLFRVIAGINRREFAIVGVSPGKTKMRVRIEGTHIGDIKVTIR